MRRWDIGIFLALLAIVTGCGPQLIEPAGGTIIDAVSNIGDGKPGSGTASGSENPGQAPSGPLIVQGELDQQGAYQLFDLGGTLPGQRWTVSADGGLFGQASFLVVLLDENQDLLKREVVSSSNPLEHIVRAASSSLYVGVSPSFGRSGGQFRFVVREQSGVTVPQPQPQVVWLNFSGATGVSVHRETGISYPPFDGDLLGDAYAGHTEEVKSSIVEAMLEDYASFNLVILTSDDGPPPEGPYATLHFGAYDARLLGLADSVDQYNQDRWQSAIIYVESFADFSVMDLTPDEMGQMIGNVASHELGHLLGLFHTQVPDDIMDTTGTAWDLAADQSFTRGELEPTVFPTGFENSPARLVETVGLNPDAPAMSKPLMTAKAIRKAEIRALAQRAARCGCGTCLNPDQ